MDGLVQRNIEDLSVGWIDEFNRALRTGDRDATLALFAADSHWRNICGITWSFATVSGNASIADAILTSAAEANACDFELFAERHPPRLNTVAGEEVIEAVLQFRSKAGSGIGVVRFKPAGAEPSGRPVAWSLMTAIEQLDGHDYTPVQDEEDQNHNRSTETGNWLDRRLQERNYDNKEPDVLIIGGGHAGLTSAVELKQLGLDALVVDGMKRIGDNWRLRYHSLKLHNVTSVNHLPYMPFPKTFPRYIPKDKIANWLESYVEHMELNFWTETRFEGAEYDAKSERWNARLRMPDGSVRVLFPAHIIMATSVSGTPKYPEIPTLDAFKGTVLHSSQLDDGSLWSGKKALVFGTGTSAHDIAQELHANGADVTMVQRSPTMVVNVDPSAQLYDGTYLDLTKRTEDLDLFNSSFPMPIIKANHKLITARVREHDKPILDALEKKGFRLEFGEDDTGWPLKYRTRGGGYYFNAGCSDLIADGSIDLIQYHDIETFNAEGLQMKDGGSKSADLAVLATGYYPPAHDLPKYYGQDVADRVGTVWNVHPETQEINNMWVRTGQPGLWFTGGSFSQCRIYSKYLARQILGVELGLLAKTVPVD